MARGDERFAAAAAALGVRVDVRRFPDGTRTAEDAARAVGCTVAQIVKSLVFVVDGAPAMALASGVDRVDPARLAAALGAAGARPATAREAREATGYAIGGVPPFGHDAPLPVVVDRGLLAHEVVWAAAGAPDACFAIAPDALLAASRGRVDGIAG
ncbi:MAG: YbaK/EbsC family protein [Thermoleophilia bacterium]